MVLPDDRWYSPDHQWVQADGDLCRVGLTDFAQDALGEVTLVRLVEVGKPVDAGIEMGEVEAFKAMSDLYMPIEASIVEVNPALESTPTMVNQDPYGAGWLCRVRPARRSDLDALLDARAYAELIGLD